MNKMSSQKYALCLMLSLIVTTANANISNNDKNPRQYNGEYEGDYLNYVADIESSIGIYLRREVLKKESIADASLRERLYEEMVADQSSDGSWNQLFVQTANNLWNLALLGYDGKVDKNPDLSVSGT